MVLVVAWPLHSTFNEWDGAMQFFAGREIVSGAGYTGWTSHFWPPLYSFLLGLSSSVIPGFWAGKLISNVCGVILLYVAYHFAMELTNEKKIALFSQLFLSLNPLYFIETLQAQNRMLDALLFVSGLFLFAKSLRQPGMKRFLGVGLVCGLAGLTRYTSYVLLALPLLSKSDFHKFIKLSLAFWFGFSLVSLPWWWYNTIANGSPLYTWQYLNIGSAVVPQENGGWKEWYWKGQSTFNTILDIFVAYPVLYLKHFASLIPSFIKRTVILTGALAPFVVPSIFSSMIMIKPKYWIILFGELSLFILMVCQAFLEDYVLLSWVVITTILSATFILDYLGRCEEKYPALKTHSFSKLITVLLVVTALLLTSYAFQSNISDEYQNGALADLDEVTLALKEHDPHIETKKVMAYHPARAYYAGSEYLLTPEYYEGSVAGLVSYEGLSDRVKTVAQKYPSNIANSELRADYLIYTSTVDVYDSPQFSFLLDPKSDKIPKNFSLVYHSAAVVVYEVHWK